MTQIALTNIGKIVSGNIHQPILEGDAILIEDGVIRQITTTDQLDLSAVDQVIDTNQMTVTPGLIDSHVHPVLGDYTPRQKTIDFIDSSKHGGVTTMISAGEAHTPGRPKDPVGCKALAILAHKSSQNARPGGVKLHGGAIILEQGLEEKDFAEMSDAGVWLVGEVGLGSVKKPEDARPMVDWAKKYGMKVQMHTGGTSIPGSSTVTAEDVMAVNPTVASHVNGGPTAVSIEEVEKLIKESDITLELVHCGNPRMINEVIRRVKEADCLERVIVGNDSPSGTGIIPLGILRTLAHIASLNNLPGEVALAMATGNTARTYGLSVGMIEEGKEADLVIMDAPMGSVANDATEALEVGDLPGIRVVIIDGQVMFKKSRNTPPAKRDVVFK